MLSRDEAIAVAFRLAPTAIDLFPGSQVYLFGSYAKGTAKPSSDIDIAVILPPGVDYEPVEYYKRCGKLNLAALGIDDRIEALVKACVDRSGFLNTIYATGVRVA